MTAASLSLPLSLSLSRKRDLRTDAYTCVRVQHAPITRSHNTWPPLVASCPSSDKILCSPPFQPGRNSSVSRATAVEQFIGDEFRGLSSSSFHHRSPSHGFSSRTGTSRSRTEGTRKENERDRRIVGQREKERGQRGKARDKTKVRGMREREREARREAKRRIERSYENKAKPEGGVW